MEDTITALIPTIPPRKHLLTRAIASVKKQTYPVTDIVIEPDLESVGGAEIRNRALEKVTTKWVAFLDDDDTWYPDHLESLLATAKAENATSVWSRWDGINQQILKKLLNQPVEERIFATPITCLVDVAAIKETEGFGIFYDYMNVKPEIGPHGRKVCGNDRVLWHRLYENGAVFAFCDKVTWTWRSDMPHTSGSPWKG